MKKATGILFLAVLLMSIDCVMGASADSRKELWQQVDEAVRKGLPQTAITNLQQIISSAMKDRAYPEAVKAIGQKIALEGNIEGNKAEERITRLEAEIPKAPKEAVPVLQALLAHWYWNYFQDNNWRFMQRTATAEPPGKDFTTWDLPRLFAEIDKHFQAALANPAIRKTAVAEWDALLVKGTMPDSYRPTLYDFLAHEALEFYVSGEQAAAKPQDAFSVDSNSPALADPDMFIAWRPWEKSTDTNSSVIRAIRLYQDLLRFHQKDPQPRDAFAHCDLERLAWAWNVASGEDKNAAYTNALAAFAGREAGNEISAMAFHNHAQVLSQQGDAVAAREMAVKGRDAFPESPGGKLCFNLIAQIEAKSLRIVTERVWNAPWPKITVNYKNIDAVHFRAVAYRWDHFIEGKNRNPENLDREGQQELVKTKPALEWKEAVPNTPAYKERVAVLKAPASLPPGFYFIIASHDPEFRTADNYLAMAPVWVSDLALITRTRSGKIEGFVLLAGPGEPVAGAVIEPWRMDQQGRRIKEPELRTDTNGFFSFKPDWQQRGWLIRAIHGEHSLTSGQDLWHHGERNDFVGTRTIFFTDRALYRPGQTVQYKGISLNLDLGSDKYSVSTERELTVLFLDPNRKEIARQKHKVNAFGSFSGSFTAPRDRLMGPMQILTEGNDGSTSIRVEEYKRPKFQTTLDRPKQAPRLNDRVAMAGHAMGYTGAAVDGAQVKYRVVRQVRMPWWWGWWRGGGYTGQDQEIANGTTTTKTDGSFEIAFETKPDPKVLPKHEPTFVFVVNADVTDTAGETRSAQQSVRVGYTALEARLAADNWQTADKPVEIKVTTQSLDGEPQVAEGSIKIHALAGPDKVHRIPIGGNDADLDGWPDDDLSSTDKWPLGKVVSEHGFTTGTNGTATVTAQLGAGVYRAVVETRDRFGKAVTGLLPIQVVNPGAPRLDIKIASLLAAPRWDALPGQDFIGLWGTGYDTGRAFIEIEHRHNLIQRFWTTPGHTQQKIQVAITEALRGGFTVHVTQVRENRSYLQSHMVSVPWKNKELDLKWEHFVSKLTPGQKETWTATITKPLDGPGTGATASEAAAAELVATLYDESLDAYAPHNWPSAFSVFAQNYSTLSSHFANSPNGFRNILTSWGTPNKHVQIEFRSFPRELKDRFRGYWFGQNYAYGGYAGRERFSRGALNMDIAASPPLAGALYMSKGVDKPASIAAESRAGDALLEMVPSQTLDDFFDGGGKAPNLAEVAARKNLNETAFFFPHLMTDSNGVVRMTFTMPEALTRWKFMGVAHDPAIRHGYLEGHAVTAKDIMVQPNPPRFLREGDEIEFTVKVSNMSDATQSGAVRLNFAEAMTAENADKLLGNRKPDQAFELPARESRSFSWRIRVPDGCGFLTYKAVAATASLSDGEEGAVPVLSRRVFVTESLPLPIRGPATKKFEFTKLVSSGGSKTLKHENLAVQMVSNPAWYAVLALPYLMEYPHECSEQVFNRLYANALARDIANRNPKIRRIFDLWKNTPALDSPLEKNQDLKSVMIEETPWLQQALAESNARKNVGILFDANRLDSESERVLRKLSEMQIGNGQWPWFPGGPGDSYITLYITTGFGRLRHLGVDINVAPALAALESLDQWITAEHKRIMERPEPESYVPSPTVALYLYGRSFFLKERPIPAMAQTPVEFFLERARQHWLKTGNRQTQAHLALALQRFSGLNNSKDETPRGIMASMKERSVSNEELGMFWRDTEYSWSWFHAPIETQALMIEAFDEIMQDAKAVEDCKVWLLKQKQTQDWKTTRATADAVYALLLRGSDLLASDALVEMKLDGIDIKPRHAGPAPSGKTSERFSPVVEPGTGFYEVRFNRAEISPKLGQITVKKSDKGVAWGSMHWQYFEDISKVTPHEGTPLKLKKALFIKNATPAGLVLDPVKGPVKVGDELVVRIELRTDRDMEYVHMKDQRGSGTEPVNVLSQYKYQDGLGYYESTRDTASHFFISYLPKGVYVFEYSTRVQLRGEYQSGLAEIQCMYAPEFNSHSESIPVTAK